jgi:hypothetical protein
VQAAAMIAVAIIEAARNLILEAYAPPGVPGHRGILDRMAPDLSLRYFRALADLPHDRTAALDGLQACFLSAEPPGALDGPTRGRLLATTVGYGIDGVAAGLTRLWMPWSGKAFDAQAKDGRNLFARGFRPIQRALWPGVEIDDAGGDRTYATFPFITWEGPSAFPPGGPDVLKIDYEHPQSPWLIRDILDELVRIEDGLYLGQALLRVRGQLRRAAWFELRS